MNKETRGTARAVPLFVLLGVALVALIPACGEDEVVGGCDPCPTPPSYQDLSRPEHVLNNLELSYNQRNISEFDRILDDRFMFFFAPTDVGGGTPPQWGRAEELSATSRLFDPQVGPPYPRCIRIQLDITFEQGVTWDDSVRTDFPGEVWHTTTVYYEFAFELQPDNTYIAVPGARTQFTVRNTGTVDAPRYKLVEWRDLGTGTVSARATPASVRLATEPTTWGQVKALYG